MATLWRPADYTPQQFIADVKRILSEQDVTEPALCDIGERLVWLSRRNDLIEIGKKRKAVNAVQSRRLNIEPDGTLALGVGEFLKSGSSEEVHSHGTWGVFCGYRGREVYTTWRRVDDMSRPGYAKLEQLEHRVLEPGQFTIMTDPPGDIHGHEPIEDSFWLLTLFGRTVDNTHRHYFTPEWKVREFTADAYMLES